MSIKKVKSKLVLVVDNTFAARLKLLENKSKQYINAKLKLQKERELIDKLLVQYEDIIISTEDKINKLKRRIDVTNRTKEIRNTRSRRSKTKNTVS
tara:strand:- start:675 stop:962 length:288 start_codon:yes stop_codon:yes gene_type:complete